MSPDPAADLARLRALCRAQPLAAEKLSHGQPAFLVGTGRIFAWFLHDHHGCGITAVAVRTTGADEQAMLTAADPDLFYRPAYLAPSGWIGYRLDVAATDWDQVAARVAASWAMAATRSVRERFGR